MKKNFLILIEDDFEIMGNGLGNVAEYQYLPALSLMNIAEKHNVKLTFMVDVAQQLTFNKYQNNPNIRIQKCLWDKTVLLMKERGFDVQLHLHPQWLNASYKDGFFYLSDNWNIGTYESSIQKNLLTESINYLQSLLKSVCPEYKVIAFKAGSLGLQPSESLLKEFNRLGIKIVIGVREGLKIPGLSIDYTNLEEKILPYHPEISDITKVSSKRNNLVVIPLQPYSPDIFTLFKLVVYILSSKLRYKDNTSFYYKNTQPNAIINQNPESGIKFLKLSLWPYQTHLKMGNQPFSYLKQSFDSTIKKLRKIDTDRIPIVIESHTKQHSNHYDQINRFITYISEKYESEVEFGDISTYVAEIENKNFVRIKNENR